MHGRMHRRKADIVSWHSEREEAALTILSDGRTAVRAGGGTPCVSGGERERK